MALGYTGRIGLRWVLSNTGLRKTMMCDNGLRMVTLGYAEFRRAFHWVPHSVPLSFLFRSAPLSSAWVLLGPMALVGGSTRTAPPPHMSASFATRAGRRTERLCVLRTGPQRESTGAAGRYWSRVPWHPVRPGRGGRGM